MLKHFSPTKLAVLWTSLILIALSIPGQSIPSMRVLEYDKLIHAGLFFILALSWLTAKSNGKLLRGLVILGLVLAFSIGSEFYQELMPIGRTADMVDAAADSAGAVLAFLVWIGIRQKLHHLIG